MRFDMVSPAVKEEEEEGKTLVDTEGQNLI